MVKIAVVGAGLAGKRHVEILARRGRLAAIVDPDGEVDAICATHGVRRFATLDDCLAENRPDGVVVASPNTCHAAHGLACVAAGIPALIEKPVADTGAAARRLVRAAEDAGVPLLIGQHRRHNPLVAVARRTLEEGRLGRLVSVHAQFWLYKPDSYFDMAWRRQQGGGPIFINLIHDLDLIRYLCGDIRRVQAMEAHTVRGHAVEDSAVVLLEFSNGALGTVNISDCIAAPWSWEFGAAENPAYPHVTTSSFRIGGTHGALSIPDMTLWYHPGERSWWAPISHERLPVGTGDALEIQMAHFCDVVAGKASPLVSGAEGLRTLEVLEAIKQAAATGRPQSP